METLIGIPKLCPDRENFLPIEVLKSVAVSMKADFACYAMEFKLLNWH